MCARLVVVTPDLSVFEQPFRVTEPGALSWQPHFNIAPTQLAPVITNETERRLGLFRFGLVPSWAKDLRIASKLINARVEGVATRNAFRRTLALRRCVIPVTGYYEWQTVHGQKRPLFIHDARGQFLPLAGLWERWHSPQGEIIESFAIITRASRGFLQDVHDRMPLLVPTDKQELWLDPSELSADALTPILGSSSAVDQLTAHAVSPAVNSPSYDAPDCIVPFSPPDPPPQRQLDLFGGGQPPPTHSRGASRR